MAALLPLPATAILVLLLLGPGALAARSAPPDVAGDLGPAVAGGTASRKLLSGCDPGLVFTSTTYRGYTNYLWEYTIAIKNDNTSPSADLIFGLCNYKPGFTSPSGVLTILDDSTCMYTPTIGANTLVKFSVTSTQPWATGNNKLVSESCQQA